MGFFCLKFIALNNTDFHRLLYLCDSKCNYKLQMKRASYIFLIFILLLQVSVFAAKPLRFVLFTDLHISVLKPQNAEDLKLAIDEVNANSQLNFVLVDGDDTDLGDTASLKIAKQLLDKLNKPYYITTGNHDTRHGKIGSGAFISVFGSDRFSVSLSGYQFIGFPTGPVPGGSLGHIVSADLQFVNKAMQSATGLPVFLITHYPLLEGDIDNRAELFDLIKKYQVAAVLNGHYHRNAVFDYNGVPGIVNRTTQRGKQPFGGYSVYTVSDSLKVAEKIIGQPELEWLAIPLK